MVSSPPLVSILIPVLNRAWTIKECIDSALNQTHKNIEIVVIDSQSTDGTTEIVEQYAAKDPRVRCYQTEKGIGPWLSWKQGLDHCAGDYVKVLFSDDWIDASFLECALNAFQNHPDVGLAFSSVLIHYADKDYSLHHYPNQVLFDSREYIRKAALADNTPVSPGCAMVRREDASFDYPIDDTEYTKIATRFGAGPDLLFMLIAASKHQSVAHIPKFLSHFRAHENSFTMAHNAEVSRAYQLALNYLIHDLDMGPLPGIENEIKAMQQKNVRRETIRGVAKKIGLV